MRILVRSPNWIGDAVMATPAVRILREGFPGATLTLWAHPRVAEVWKHHPYVSEVVTPPATRLGWLRSARRLRGRQFDVGVVLPLSWSSAWFMRAAGVREALGFASGWRGLWLSRSLRPSQPFRTRHASEEYAELAAAVVTSVGRAVPAAALSAPWFGLSPYDEARAEVFLMAHGVRGEEPVVALAPGATYGPAKRWFADRYAELGRALIRHHAVRLLLVGSHEERAALDHLAQAIGGRGAIVVEGLPLGVAAALMKRSRVLIGNDTGLIHVAAALRVPVVALFGSTSPVWTGPRGPEEVPREVLYRHVACSPCFRRTCARPAKDYLCLQEIQVSEVLERVNALLPVRS